MDLLAKESAAHVLWGWASP